MTSPQRCIGVCDLDRAQRRTGTCRRDQAVGVSSNSESRRQRNHEPPKSGIPKRKKTETRPRLSCKIEYLLTLNHSDPSIASEFFTDDHLMGCQASKVKHSRPRQARRSSMVSARHLLPVLAGHPTNSGLRCGAAGRNTSALRSISDVTRTGRHFGERQRRHLVNVISRRHNASTA